ncbi:hypothetical protein BJ875DRAFT_490134 [Amylocarpus encephaloides]|uniref:Uncharacterized protein n=1 Tax=Amylocarpus encephaloides TaxID=45428 RepID=A0A9P7Y6E8_9HELO|nr:hypothetical protein BJ875DRAFT_490134 [Amylocarpus encephaloides]
MNSQDERTESDIALQPFIEFCASLNTTDPAEKSQVLSQMAQASHISSIQSTATATPSFETRISSSATTPTSSTTTAIVILTQITRPTDTSINTTTGELMNGEAAVWHPSPGGINWLIGTIISIATFVLIPLWILSGKILDKRRQRKARNAAHAVLETEVTSPTAPDREEKAQLPGESIARHEMPLNPKPTPELLGVAKDKERYELHSQDILEIETVERPCELPVRVPAGRELPVFDEPHLVAISEFYRVLR